jgi:hypothetical protein
MSKLVAISQEEFFDLLSLESAANNLVLAMPACICEPEYKDRQLAAPYCIRCQLQPEWDEFLEAVRKVA